MTENTSESTKPWLWKPGVSANPGGRPKGTTEMSMLAREFGPAAIRRLVQLMMSKNENVAVRACEVLLDRGYGRPAQALMVASIAASYAGGPIANARDAAEVYLRVIRGEVDPASVTFAAHGAGGGDQAPADAGPRPEANAAASPARSTLAADSEP